MKKVYRDAQSFLKAIFGYGEPQVTSLNDILDDETPDYQNLMQPKDASSWALRGDRFYSVDVTHRALPAGVYVVKNDNNGGKYFVSAPFNTDDIFDFPGTPVKYVLDQIDTFWKNKKLFQQCGFLHKRGVLFYGAAGCGKTSILKLLADKLIAKNGVVIYVSDFEYANSGLKLLRKIEPDRPVMTIMEDVETHMSHPEQTREFLSFLDGENQVGNIVHVATTNVPEELEDRVIKRPGRFDLVIGVNPPVKEARYAYLKNQLKKIDIDDKELAELVDMTHGLGFSHLRELCVCTICLGLDRKETLARLKDNVKKTVKQKKLGDSTNLGFTINFEAT